MDQTTTLWLFGTLITLLTIVIGAIATALWAHIGQCKELSAVVSRIDTNLERAMKDIDRIGPRAHDAINAALGCKADLVRISERLARLEQREDKR